MVTDPRIHYLFNRYVNGESTPEETIEFFRVVDDPENKTLLYQLMGEDLNPDTYQQSLDADQRERILGQIFRLPTDENVHQTKSNSFPLWSKMLGAAVVLVILSLTIYYLGKQHAEPRYAAFKGKIMSGGNKAVLTLANGSQVSLTDLSEGQLIQEADVRIRKGADGQLVYHQLDTTPKSSTPIAFNTITTPAGGQYRVVLPDGTQVWINAATSLKYPTTFATSKERRVELNGEAYFEVAKFARKGQHVPFVVSGHGQEVKVLGTHFNVNAYQNEQDAVTTLLEGSVQVGRPGGFQRVLSPGEELRVGAGITLNKIDTNNAVAWKNGLFKFDNADIHTVMNQLSRWYDLDVEYRGKVPRNRFNGEVYRNMEAAKAFQLLTLARITYKLESPVNHEGRKRIIIMAR